MSVCLAGCRRGAAPAADEQGGIAPSEVAAPASFAPTAPAPPVESPLAGPTDPSDCTAAACHGSLLTRASIHLPMKDGECTACHVPQDTPHRFELACRDPQLCLHCHSAVGSRPHVHEALPRHGCLACHDPHGSEGANLLNRAGVELTCLACHPVERHAYLHGPFVLGECTACHDPHGSDNPGLLVGGAGDEHCFTCHGQRRRPADASGKPHEPMARGCDACHVPHSSPNRGLLASPVETLCFSCHPDVEKKVATADTPHGAVLAGRRCAHCHDSHADMGEYLLRTDETTLCLGCHGAAIVATDGRTIPDMRAVLTGRAFEHGPVEAGQCTACHDVHGGRSTRLLRERFPARFYDSFDIHAYALCFQCHDPQLVTVARSSTATGFRAADVNLHYVHVHRSDKGRTCRTCHEIHGSDLPRHMASQVPFESGGWTLPIAFQKTSGGGRCSPGCHRPYEYDRDSPLTVTDPPAEPADDAPPREGAADGAPKGRPR